MLTTLYDRLNADPEAGKWWRPPRERKCCGTCQHHKLEETETESTEWMCCNENSENFGAWTDFADYCEDWEERDDGD